MYKFQIVAILFLFSDILHSQENQLKRVPKQYTIKAGYEYALSSDFKNIANNGLSIGFDYAWQLSGLNGKKAPAYISIPIYYTYFSGQSVNDSSMRMVTYGWTVRHHLTKNNKLNYYLGYCLFLNQLKISEKPGSLIGHQTKFMFGLNVGEKKIIPFIECDYSMTRFPKYKENESNWIHIFGIKSGIRF